MDISNYPDNCYVCDGERTNGQGTRCPECRGTGLTLCDGHGTISVPDSCGRHPGDPANDGEDHDCEGCPVCEDWRRPRLVHPEHVGPGDVLESYGRRPVVSSHSKWDPEDGRVYWFAYTTVDADNVRSLHTTPVYTSAMPVCIVNPDAPSFAVPTVQTSNRLTRFTATRRV